MKVSDETFRLRACLMFGGGCECVGASTISPGGGRAGGGTGHLAGRRGADPLDCPLIDYGNAHQAVNTITIKGSVLRHNYHQRIINDNQRVIIKEIAFQGGFIFPTHGWAAQDEAASPQGGGCSG